MFKNWIFIVLICFFASVTLGADLDLSVISQINKNIVKIIYESPQERLCVGTGFWAKDFNGEPILMTCGHTIRCGTQAGGYLYGWSYADNKMIELNVKKYEQSGSQEVAILPMARGIPIGPLSFPPSGHLDYAILGGTPPKNLSPLEFGENAPSKDEALFAFVCVGDEPLKVVEVKVLPTESDKDSDDFFPFCPSLNAGASGGPILNKKGKVVGMVEMRGSWVGFARKSTQIRQVLGFKGG